MIGRILGVCFGYTLLKPFGLGFMGVILGFWLGRRFDQSFSNTSQNGSFFFSYNHTRVQKVFFDVSFSVMGHIAKSDGVVSKNEIRVAEEFMQQLKMNAVSKKEARAAFNRGKSNHFDLRAEMMSLLKACSGQIVLLRLFIDIQYKAASADGLNAKKLQLLKQINDYLGFSRSANYRDYRNYNSGDAYTTYKSDESILKDAYSILEISSSVSDREVTTAYRKLISKNHPDKLISQGLPKEMVKLANEKTAEIKSAYDHIKKYRNMK